jgi:predicted transcriptional regulator
MALFRDLTPIRWQLVETLQQQGPMSLRSLARSTGVMLRTFIET